MKTSWRRERRVVPLEEALFQRPDEVGEKITLHAAHAEANNDTRSDKSRTHSIVGVTYLSPRRLAPNNGVTVSLQRGS